MTDISAKLTDQLETGEGVVTVQMGRDAQCHPSDLYEIPASVAEAEGMTSVNLSGTSITDLTPLANLTGLRYLDLSGIPAVDFTPLGPVAV